MLLAALAVPRGVRSAGSLDGDFQVRSAFVVVDHGVLQLSAHVEYPINDRIRGALRDGVTLAFDLDVTISRRRRLWRHPHPWRLCRCRCPDPRRCCRRRNRRR